MTKKYDNSSSLQQKLIEGIDILADNVASTLGPRGRNVIIHQKGQRPFVTKDGVTVAKFVQLEDEFQNAAVEILKQASEQTNDNAGDGTTTATVLSRAIYKEAIKHITAGANPIELKRGLMLVLRRCPNNLMVSHVQSLRSMILKILQPSLLTETKPSAL